MTLEVFKKQMDRLAGLKFAPASIQTHYEALKDMPEVLLAAAVEKAQQEVSDFPSPKMLKIFADQVRPRIIRIPEEDRTRAVDLAQPIEIRIPQAGTVIPVGRLWTYYCETCSDAGRVEYRCAGSGAEYVGFVKVPDHQWVLERDCGLHRAHYAHEWSDRCVCYEDNPAVQRRLERQQQSGRRGGEAE